MTPHPIQFRRLNHGWNAEPNAPDQEVVEVGADVLLSFYMNPYLYPEFSEGDRGTLRFFGCDRYRLGSTNDEGWYRGQCRFSKLAPQWGEFYEVDGELEAELCPQDYILMGETRSRHKHYLFYLRDATFECDAEDWSLTVQGRHVAGRRP